MPSNITRFLARNKERFGTTDGLPGEFHRKELFAQVKPGARAAFVTPHGFILSGRVVMRFSTHAVLNLGGRHGTPGVLTPETCVYAAGATF
jgi:hypothetical protein